MKALILAATDGVQGAMVRDVDTPVPKAGEVRVALKAASVNHRELWICRGQYPGMLPVPFGLGCDGAGVIDAVGKDVDPRRIGEEVMLYPGLNWGPDARFPGPQFGLLGMPGPGTLAEYVCLSSAHAVTKPDFLSFSEAAAIPLTALTAWRGLTTKAGLRAREKILITGAGGGVATFALHFAVELGAEVYVTGDSDDTIAKAVACGAKVGVKYKDDNWGRALRKASAGFDVVFDGAPAVSYSHYGRALNMGARIVVYGSTAGSDFPINAPELFLKNATIIGTNVGNLDEFREMLAFLQAKRIKPSIDRQFHLHEAEEALIYLQDSHRFGKVVVSI